MPSQSTRTLGLALSAVALLALTGPRSQAQVTPLPPGTINAPVATNNNAPFGGTFVDNLAGTFSATSGAGTISGTLFSAVFRTTGNTLDFYYQIALDAASVDARSFSITSYQNIDLSSAGFGVAQTANDLALPPGADPGGNFFTVGSLAIAEADRSLGDGNAIFGEFAGFLTAGSRSNLFIARTNFTVFSREGDATIFGEGISANTNNVTLAPLAAGSSVAPEPGSALLALCGASVAAGLVVVRRRRQGA